jgi:hypothetical protein
MGRISHRSFCPDKEAPRSFEEYPEASGKAPSIAL